MANSLREQSSTSGRTLMEIFRYDIKAVIKSGYPDYPKSGFIRTILETEIRSLKTGKPVLGLLVGRALF